MKRIKDYYKLADNAAILDIGCGKEGFMLYDFKELMPGRMKQSTRICLSGSLLPKS